MRTDSFSDKEIADAAGVVTSLQLAKPTDDFALYMAQVYQGAMIGDAGITAYDSLDDLWSRDLTDDPFADLFYENLYDDCGD